LRSLKISPRIAGGFIYILGSVVIGFLISLTIIYTCAVAQINEPNIISKESRMSCCKQSGSETCCELDFGQTAPDFNLPGVDGRNWNLADFKDKKALVVIFSCNHCPYVIKSEERMIELGKEYLPKDVGFVLISANNIITHPQDSPENMKKRAEQKSYPFPYLYNEDQKVARAYSAQVTPHVFLFDSEMKLRYRGSIDDNINNPDDVNNHYLEDAIETILAGTPEKITNRDTKPVGCSIKWK